MARVKQIPKFKKNSVVCAYFMQGKLYMRAASSLKAERVRTSPEFRNTMINAGLMGRASKIGSLVYRSLPDKHRKYSLYRLYTGKAMKLLKTGMNDQEVTDVLMRWV